MTMNTDYSTILCDFAGHAPEEFAIIVDGASLNDATALLGGLPIEPCSAVLAHLSPTTLDSILGDLYERVLECIEKGPLEYAKGILSRLPKHKRRELVGKLPIAPRRRRLRRFINYPTHSVGTLASSNLIIIADEMDTVSALEQIKRSSSGRPVLLETKDGRYAGVMSARKVIEGSTNDEFKIFADYVKPLLAESPVLEIVDAEQWRKNTIVPVVDHENRILGVVDRIAVINACRNSTPQVERLQDMMGSVLGMYLKMLAVLLSSVFRKESST